MLNKDYIFISTNTLILSTMQNQVKQTINTLPKGMQGVYKVADQCVKHLIITKKQSFVQAEGAVLEILKEHTDYLKREMYSQVCSSLKLIFMEEKTTTKDLLNFIKE